jgi:hypothetical protein
MTDVQKLLLSIDPVWMTALSVVLVAYLLISLWSDTRRAMLATRRSAPADRHGSSTSGDDFRSIAPASETVGPQSVSIISIPQVGPGEPESRQSPLPPSATSQATHIGIATVKSLGAPFAPKSTNAQPSGTRKGLDYADDFAAAFVDWAWCQGREGQWPVDDVLRMACKFADESKRELPVHRNLLQSLKRHPGVIVKADRRIYDGAGRRLGKTTIYELSRS